MPKIRIREGQSKDFFLDSAGRVRKSRVPRDRYCDGCGENLGAHAGHVCVACWAECKTFRRYLREVLGFEPIKGDGPGDQDDAQRFQSFGGVAFEART